MKHILTNYQAVRFGCKATDSDHFTEYMDLDLQIIKEKPVREEVYNFKNKECQNRFKELTFKQTTLQIVSKTITYLLLNKFRAGEKC